MVQSNKILTVSYGTFSCTLEGFDDSFDTMKAIAEYFRDLASDDRYFGAEPPTPDAEMLARIAEREIARRVEARMDDAGVYLRADPSSDTDARDDVPQVAESEEEITSSAPAQISAAAPALAAGVAAAVTGAHAVDDAEEERADDAFDGAEDELVSEPMEEEAEAPEVERDLEPVTAEADDAVVEAEVVNEPVAESAPETDSVAAKLARIRAVVSAEADEGAEAGASEYSEDEHADDVSDEVEEVVDTISETFEAASEDAALEDAVAEDEADDGVTAGLLDRVKSTIGSGDQSDDLDEVRPVVEEPKAQEPEVAEAPSDKAADIADVMANAEPANEADDASESPEAMAEPAPVAAPAPKRPVRVVRVKRGVRKAAAPTPEKTHEPAPEPQAITAPEATLKEQAQPLVLDAMDRVADDASGALSPEDEDELMRELAQVEAELDDSDLPEADALDDVADDVSEAEPEEDDASDPEISRSIRALTRRVRMSENAAGQGDEDVSRLMAETEAQLDEPEGRGRRSAIAHLRAAVAATREERQSDGVEDVAQSREAQFREDLDVVRPRPDAEAARKVAPLKLVAEQRVDLEAEDGDDRGPTAAELRAAPAIDTVRPRRIAPRRPAAGQSRADASAAEGDSGFMAYAEEIGANGLPELLEAAAAYMTLVEKRTQFSRPQLMSKVREAETTEFSRDDRLRYFGQLLRDGKIEKTESGRFTASETIGFRPDARAAG